MNTETIRFSNTLHENQNKNWIRAIDSSKIISWIDDLFKIIFPEKALETIKPLFEKAVELKKTVANGSATEKQISVELQKIEQILNAFANQLYSI